MKQITLILHKLSGSQDSYGTIKHEIYIPNYYTYRNLAHYIVSEGFLQENEGLPNYIKKEGDYLYDFFEDFQDSAVIKDLDLIIHSDVLIFSPNYYNYPKDPRLTLNYVYIRKDMRNMRWEKNKQKRIAVEMSEPTCVDVSDLQSSVPKWSYESIFENIWNFMMISTD